MAFINFNAADVDPNQSFEPIPAGKYVAAIVDSTSPAKDSSQKGSTWRRKSDRPRCAHTHRRFRTYDSSVLAAVAVTLASMAETRGSHGCVLTPDRKIVVTAGEYQATTEIYDLVSGTWSAGPSLPIALYAANAVLMDGLPTVLGGRDISGDQLNEAIFQLTDANEWVTRKETLPTPRMDTASLVVRARHLSGCK